MSISLDQLPTLEGNQQGFPWSVASECQAPETAPTISIVIPSYNQKNYLEHAIRSVLLQGYPNIELIIIDGGSTDGSVDLIKKYAQNIAYWVSEPDRGQSHAVNKGFEIARGDWIGWMNSDDCYLPGAFNALWQTMTQAPQAEVLYGDWQSIDQESNILQHWPAPARFAVEYMPPYCCICTQSTFYARKIIEAGHLLKEELVLCMDIEYFWRLALLGFKFEHVAAELGAVRLYEETKTEKLGQIRSKELFEVYMPLLNSAPLSQKARRGLLQTLYDFSRIDFLPERREQFLSRTKKLSEIEPLPLDLQLRVAVAQWGEEPMRFVRSLKTLTKPRKS